MQEEPMTTLPAAERQELAHSVRAACQRLAPEERVRTVAFDYHGKQRGFDRDFWKVLCNQIGVAAIALPEHLGGAGCGALELGVVAHELGRVLAPVPFVASTVLASGLLAEANADPTVLARLSDGECTATAALTGDGGIWDSAAVSVSAHRAEGTWTVDGTVGHVLGGSTADFLVIVAMAGNAPAVFLLDSATSGITVTAEQVLDDTRPMATITFTSTPAEPLNTDEPAEALIGRCVDRTLAVLSAEQVGACERVLEIATEYARRREQFGRPIGSFQAIKHRCADMLIGLEFARSASHAALQALDANDVDTRWLASMAKAVCSEALRDAAHANLQIHGGIGYTWEDSAGLYLKRARTDEVLFGKPGEHWDLLAPKALHDGYLGGI
jgi:alkylation response protein AidB-like acyl-CoA dehydrogenase